MNILYNKAFLFYHRMQVFIHQLDGTVVNADLSQYSSLEDMLLSLNAAECRAICQGSHVSSLEELNNNANVYITADLSGGKRKRKKKVYTTKKKNKHIHKKSPMAIYNLYSVDGKGNVTQARKTCPSCGPGIFMGQHWDRYYCGFCHTTIKMDPETVKKNEEILKKKKAALEAEAKAKAKEAADKAPAGKGKKDAKKGKKK